MQTLFKKSGQIVLLLLLLLSASLTVANGEQETLQESFDLIKKEFESLDKQKVKTRDISTIKVRYDLLKPKLDECIGTDTTQLETLRNNLKLLGEQQKTEAADLKSTRTDIETQIETADTSLKRCTLLKIQLEQINEQLNTLQNDVIRQQLLNREYTPLSAFAKITSLDRDIYEAEIETILPIFITLYETSTWPVLLLALAGIGLGFLWQRRGAVTTIDHKLHSSITLVATQRGIRGVAVLILPLLFIWLYLHIEDIAPVLLIETLQFSLVLLIIYALIRGVLFPDLTSITTSKLSLNTLRTLSWLFILLTILTFVFSNENSAQFSESAVLYLVWLGSLGTAAFSIISVTWMLMHGLAPKTPFSGIFLLPLSAVAASVVAALLGFRNLATLLFFGTLGSIVVLVIGLLIYRIINEFFDSLDEGRLGWQKKMRAVMNVDTDRAFPGVLWLRILFFFLVIFVGLFALLLVWGRSQERMTTLLLSLNEGITIGSITLDPFGIINAFLILVVILSALPYIKNQLVPGWLKHSNLSRGAIEATQTLVGYAGVAVAILWALYSAGVNFKNLAIIAGALSVGIGFGLQNIVNNFVSGLILLFERPIRRGDWIVVGSTEGYVKNISIRSTTIQTFERADVIVPNSELISSQVTNWMLSNTIGRVTAPVGVAYGSDVQKVIKILELIADEHPEVISNHPDYPVRALFRGFGDSSLNFELRCFVRNVDNRLTIQSTLNQCIDSEFRRANIEIPFPQRVVHLHNEDTEVPANK